MSYLDSFCQLFWFLSCIPIIIRSSSLFRQIHVSSSSFRHCLQPLPSAMSVSDWSIRWSISANVICFKTRTSGSINLSDNHLRLSYVRVSRKYSSRLFNASVLIYTHIISFHNTIPSLRTFDSPRASLPKRMLFAVGSMRRKVSAIIFTISFLVINFRAAKLMQIFQVTKNFENYFLTYVVNSCNR